MWEDTQRTSIYFNELQVGKVSAIVNGKLKGDSLFVREGPGQRFKEIEDEDEDDGKTRLKTFDNVKVLECSDNRDRIGGYTSYWYKIKTPKGKIGWAYSAYLSSYPSDFSL
jgi:hypothetical protein